MPRSRNIKPGFFINEELADCDIEARLLFIALWTLADREGRLEYRPRRIKINSLPYDDVNIEHLIKQLIDRGFVFAYEVSGQQILQVNNWAKHQNPHHKEVASVLPKFNNSMDDSCIIDGRNMQTPSTVCDGYIPLSNTIRDRIRKRDGLKCNYCESSENPEVDHIIPVTKGGNSTDDNLQILCRNCNSLKYNHLVNQELSIKHGRVMLESCMDHAQTKENASCPTDSLLLIPDTLIPDSCSLIPDKPLNNKTKRFKKPTLEEIKQHIRLIGYSVNPVSFFNHYESNGWKVGKNPMKNWKAAINTWEAKNEKPQRITKKDYGTTTAGFLDEI